MEEGRSGSQDEVVGGGGPRCEGNSDGDVGILYGGGGLSAVT